MNFKYNQHFLDFSMPWAGHKYFVYDLVTNVRPSKIVELGTFKGTSMFAMLQSISDNNLNTEFNAIDSWEGDQHAGFYEGDQWLKDIEGLIEKHYNQQNVILHRKYFDQALELFEENTVDILHIDGLHTYEAVKHDFETWLPKLNVNGFVLFHDIAEKREDFGVWQLWDELKKSTDYYTIEFIHSHGLGVLTRSKTNKEILDRLLLKERDYMKAAYEDLKIYSIQIERTNKELNRELKFIHDSKYWKLKAQIKRVLGKK